VEHQLREEHEEYPRSLMSMERYDLEIHEDVHRSQGPPFMRGVEIVEHTRTHGDSRARGSYEDTSICVPGLVDLHVEDDPVVHPCSRMLQVYTRDHMSMQGHTVMSTSNSCTSNMCHNHIKKCLKHASISPRNVLHTCTTNIPHTMHIRCASSMYQCLNKIPNTCLKHAP
jgi:hypothetical protein